MLVVLWAPRPQWFDDARCSGVGPALFYAERGDEAVARQARAVCAQCPVARQCLDHALTNAEVHGIWGGTNGHERAVMRRRRPA